MKVAASVYKLLSIEFDDEEHVLQKSTAMQNVRLNMTQTVSRKRMQEKICFSLGITILLAVQAGIQADVVTPPEVAAENSTPDTALSLEELAKKTRPSLVLVRSTDRTGAELGQGAGFVIDDKGLIVTARHVIGDGRDIVIELPDGTKTPVTEVYASSHQLDLAIIRIESHALPPLDISGEDEIAQGRDVVALGHPHGRLNTLASGIVSGHRDIEGIRMLQLAMSIEPGNSGGPVLDRQGKVVGIVTMKSTETDDVGFALPVKLLRDLNADPNPIPIDRWRTIGALDARLWQPLFAANWRQRAGHITVNGAGTSFGGRTLCVNQSELPPLPFDLKVIVKLGDEKGAAGLIFHSDGDQKHYGFYPSAGNLRLTRFDGPDVNSWTILHNEQHEEYRPGEWNTLTVRIHADRFECFVNGTKVVESTDSVLPSGKSGLAAFRGTEAEFRRFEIGQNLLPSSLDPETRTQIQKLADAVLPGQPADQSVVSSLLPFGEPASDFLDAEASILEQRAQQLRLLSSDVHDTATRTQLAAALGIPTEATSDGSEPEADKAPEAAPPSGETNLLRAALLLAHMDNPDIDVVSYMNRMDEMAAELRETFPPDANETQRLILLDKYLFENLGVRGSRFEYYARSNSYLNEVIDDREGLPITLSVLYMELAKRVDLNVEGVGLPGHFVVRFQPKDSALTHETIDPFERGRRLTEQDIANLISSAGFPNEPRFREAKSLVQILERMTMNLLGNAESERNDQRVLRYLETLVMLAPENPEYRAKRLELRARTGRLGMAIADANWFIKNLPDGVDVERVRELRQTLEVQLERQQARK